MKNVLGGGGSSAASTHAEKKRGEVEETEEEQHHPDDKDVRVGLISFLLPFVGSSPSSERDLKELLRDAFHPTSMLRKISHAYTTSPSECMYSRSSSSPSTDDWENDSEHYASNSTKEEERPEREKNGLHFFRPCHSDPPRHRVFQTLGEQDTARDLSLVSRVYTDVAVRTLYGQCASLSYLLAGLHWCLSTTDWRKTTFSCEEKTEKQDDGKKTTDRHSPRNSDDARPDSSSRDQRRRPTASEEGTPYCPLHFSRATVLWTPSSSAFSSLSFCPRSESPSSSSSSSSVGRHASPRRTVGGGAHWSGAEEIGVELSSSSSPGDLLTAAELSAFQSKRSDPKNSDGPALERQRKEEGEGRSLFFSSLLRALRRQIDQIVSLDDGGEEEKKKEAARK